MNISIPIPSDAKCLLKNGQTVNFETPFYENSSSEDIKIHIAKKLGIKPAVIFRYVKKYVGEQVKKGELLGIKKNLFTTSKVISEYEGMIKEIDHNDGSILISSRQGQIQKTNCYFIGEIIEINKNAINLKVKSFKEFTIKPTTINFGGETAYISNDKQESIVSSQINNRILVIDSISSYIQSKVEALGVIGFITLTKLNENSSLPMVQLKQIEDFKKINDLQHPYCIVDIKSSKIYFYH
ncbi:MAG: hypothetical protein Q7R95_04595 [bacterium]|nr:hypothetical protein [bacterium]